MANVDRPSGARPVQHLDGSPWNGKSKMYSVDSANATAIFPGDFVKLEADGNIAPAAAGDVILGVAVGIVPDPNDLSKRYIPALTAGTVLVVDAPDVIFEVQEDSDASSLALADVGNNVDIVAGAGSTSTGQSGHELDSSSKVATTAQLRVYGLVPREDNAVGTNAKWLVFVNEHLFKTTAGI